MAYGNTLRITVKGTVYSSFSADVRRPSHVLRPHPPITIGGDDYIEAIEGSPSRAFRVQRSE